MPGTYFLQACADGPGTMAESNELNNCLTTPQTIQVLTVPGLVVTSLGNPRGSAAQGGSFSVTSTVQNIGEATAGESTTKFYLAPVGGGARRDMKGTRQVPSLAPNATFTEATLVTVRAETPQGAYNLQACADSPRQTSPGRPSRSTRAPTRAAR